MSSRGVLEARGACVGFRSYPVREAIPSQIVPYFRVFAPQEPKFAD